MAKEGRPRGPIEEEIAFHARMIELERERKRYEREIAAFEEIERRYGDLMDSPAFLYAFVDLGGGFLQANRGMRDFLGQDSPRTLATFCPQGQLDTLHGLLMDAQYEPVSALVPLVRGDGAQLWMDVHLSPAALRGADAVQIVGMDVTAWAALDAERRAAGGRDAWARVLDSCPGLLCCVVDGEGRLLYASQGYRSVALRVLGHRCELGRPYPPMRTKMDRALHSVLASACRGTANGVELTEGEGMSERLWSFAAAPLRTEEGPSGAVVRILPSRAQDAPDARRHDLPRNVRPMEPPAPAPLSTGERAAILDSLAVRAAVVDGRGNCLAVNAALAMTLEGTDVTPRSPGFPLLDLVPQDDPVNDALREGFPALLASREGAAECRLPMRDGELLWLEVRARPVDWGSVPATMLTFTDVTRLRRTREQLERVKETDHTTGILNRQGMERLLRQRLERALAGHAPLSLMILDIDGFRRLNETRGYAAADRALKALIVTFEDVLSKEELVGRWGGDEFMVLTPRTGAGAMALASLLRDGAGADGPAGPLSLSVGVAELQEGMDVSAFVGAAYDAMASAKRSGGDRAVLSGEQGPESAEG